MKEAPFYPNHEDNMRCMLAVYGSILDYLWGQKFDWDELIRLTGYQPKKAAWTVKALTELGRKGIDIRMIEPFDYRRYADEGVSYLKSQLSPDDLDWQLKNSNILDIKPQLPEFLSTINYECRRASLQDIDELLNEDRLVFITLNSKTLNNKSGYASHAVLVLDKDGDDYIFHDPGLPPVPYRREKKAKIYDAMGGNDNTSEVTGFKAGEK